jgi:integrase
LADAGFGVRRCRPLAAKSVANVAGIVHKALKEGVRRGRLHRNPADAVSPPTATRTRTNWWTVEQLRRFLLHVADDELYAAWLLFATTGARTGAVAGLTWDKPDYPGSACTTSGTATRAPRSRRRRAGTTSR